MYSRYPETTEPNAENITPIAVKEMHNPDTIAIGRSFPVSAEYAMIAGSSGSTHGDSTLKTPAANAAMSEGI